MWEGVRFLSFFSSFKHWLTWPACGKILLIWLLGRVLIFPRQSLKFGRESPPGRQYLSVIALVIHVVVEWTGCCVWISIYLNLERFSLRFNDDPWGHAAFRIHFSLLVLYPQDDFETKCLFVNSFRFTFKWEASLFLASWETKVSPRPEEGF